MAEAGDEKGTGAWSRVPTWDGSPLSWRAFRREMTWWISSLDLESTKKYNLAARLLLRQQGIVRQRGEEFSPDELQYQPSIVSKDPQTGEEFEIQKEDCLAGLNRLLKALEDMHGQTILDKRGELRSEFCTRFRTLVSDLKAEGVTLPDAELGWFLKEKLGLDPLRKQLLETALQGSESYAVIESESLRLFKDLHTADPLYRKMERPKLTIRRLFQSGPSSSSSSSGASTVSRSPSMFSRASSRTGAGSTASTTRKVYLAEVPEDQADEEIEESTEDQQINDPMVAESPGIEEILQGEAECFAAELQHLEESGVEPETLEGLEANFERAAEALVTMKEARSKLQEIRKDRGYGKSSLKSSSNQPGARKASGKHPCFDCNMHGHWAGYKECTMPGAGLGRKGVSPKAKAKHVRVAEAFSAAHDPSVTIDSVWRIQPCTEPIEG